MPRPCHERAVRISRVRSDLWAATVLYGHSGDVGSSNKAVAQSSSAWYPWHTSGHASAFSAFAGWTFHTSVSVE